jgi:hypothetical protein
MGDKGRGLNDEPVPGALSEGAARFDRMIEQVRMQYVRKEEGAPVPVSNPLTAVSPEEEWSSRYRSLGIASEPGNGPPMEFPRFPRLSVLPELAPAKEPAKETVKEMVREVEPPRDVLAVRSVGPAEPPAPHVVPRGTIGARIGRSRRGKKSWLGRVMGF